MPHVACARQELLEDDGDAVVNLTQMMMMTCQTFSLCWPVLGPDMNTGDKDEDEEEDEEDEEVAVCRLYTATLPS